jgi:signal transduction histidine kinase/ActR/RegA family two-component response regulator
MRVQSLARRFLISVGLMAVAVTLVASVVAYLAFRGELERRAVVSLGDYVSERALREERQFSDLTAVHRAATEALKRRLDAQGPELAERLFELNFPRKGDGTRRTAPDLFDGRTTQMGDTIYGVGGFLSRAEAMTAEERRVFAAAVPVTSRFGEALKGVYDNFYFYTPDTRMVMFAPDREDRLMFYRENAPATLDIGGEQMARIVRPAENPAGATRCTDLQRKVTEKEGARSGVACVTPVYIRGRFVGAWGSSLELSGYFRRAVGQSLPGSTNMIISGDGRLIAFPEAEGLAGDAQVSERERALGLADVAARIRAQGKRTGVVKSADGSRLIAYGLLRGPNWYFLVATPSSQVAAAATRSAAWILLVGVLAAVGMSVAVMLLARRTVITPLRRLLASAEAERETRGSGRDTAAIEHRGDEIGQLAQALRSERERADEVLASLEERVAQRTVELEHALQEKSRFLANMSHELRTPLNGVVAVSEVLGRRQKSRRDRELAEVIIASGRLLEQVLTDILDVSKIEAGQMRLQPADFDLDALVRQIASLHRAAAESKGLKLDWSIDEAARGAWRADPVRLTQILSNLLSNAVKFTERGAVSLAVGATRQGLCFRVRDTGIGFDAETGRRLFQRFEQADDSITRRFGGTGLGLSICRALAGMMGGTITAESTPGEGSTFTLEVPLERAAAPVHLVAAAQPRVLDSAVKVLLAEDHPTNQKVVALILETAGIAPTVVCDGRQALDALAGERFDAVLMDMQMPEMDGLTATAKLRARERAEGLARTPVIMLTANALDEHAVASRDAGADLHITKPVRPDVLLAAIARVTGRADADEEERLAG